MIHILFFNIWGFSLPPPLPQKELLSTLSDKISQRNDNCCKLLVGINVLLVSIDNLRVKTALWSFCVVQDFISKLMVANAVLC